MYPKTVLAVANLAGSAGKTTTAVTLATLLADQGVRVLLADFDAQANATEFVGHDPDETSPTSADVLLRQAALADAILTTSVDNLWLLPASRRGMDAAVLQLAGVRAPEQQLKVALQACPDEIEVVIIDCPGSLGIMTMNALVAATGVVTVTVPAAKELKGIPYLEELVDEVRDYYNPDLILGAVVPCIVPPASAGRLAQDGMADLAEAYGDRVTPPVRRTVRAQEAMARNIPLPVYVPTDPVTKDYIAVLAHLKGAGLL